MTDRHRPHLLGGGKEIFTLKSNYYKMGIANFLQVLGKTNGCKFTAPAVTIKYDTD